MILLILGVPPPLIGTSCSNIATSTRIMFYSVLYLHNTIFMVGQILFESNILQSELCMIVNFVNVYDAITVKTLKVW